MAEMAGCMCNVSMGVLSGFVSSGADAIKSGFGMLLGSAKMFFKYAPVTPWGVYNTFADAPKLLTAAQALADGLVKLGEFLYNATALEALQAFSPDLHNVVAFGLGQHTARGVSQDQVCASVGQLIGGAAFEIVMTVATLGASGALKAIKCSKLVVGAVDALDDLLPDSSVVRYLRRHTGCFVAGTLIWTAAGATPIEDVALGAPMQTSAEHADAQTPESRAADARRTMQVKVTFVQADTAEQAMELVTWVPPEWFPEFGEPRSAVGQVRHLEDYDFTGEVAKVEVLAIREPGAFADGPVVVATSRRDGPIPKVELRFEGETEALRATTEHPVYSVTRDGWIHAGALASGETVKTLAGEGRVRVASVRTYVDDTPVYNLEVSDHHNYFVGSAGVLVHNANDCALDVVGNGGKNPIGVRGRRAIDRGSSFEDGVRSMYGDVPIGQRRYQAIVDGKAYDGVADNIAVINGRDVPIEAKFVDDWGDSLRNPANREPWALAEQEAFIFQAKKYESAFGGVIYHTNSPELIAHYSRVLQGAGVKNVQFILTEIVIVK